MTLTHLLELLGISGIDTGHLTLRPTFDGLFAVMGLIALLVAAYEWARTLSAQGWPVTTGTVTHVGMTSSAGGGRRTYTPEITYQYEVNGVTYTGERWAFGGTRLVGTDYQNAERVRKKYRKGGRVSVHYNPANPKDSVLEVRAAHARGLLLIGCVFVIIGLGSALLGFGLG